MSCKLDIIYLLGGLPVAITVRDFSRMPAGSPFFVPKNYFEAYISATEIIEKKTTRYTPK